MSKRIYICITLMMVCVCVFAQNWEVNMLHDINGWNGQFIHDYSRFISKTEPYVVLGVPTVMGIVGLIKKDKQLQKDAPELLKTPIDWNLYDFLSWKPYMPNLQHRADYLGTRELFPLHRRVRPPAGREVDDAGLHLPGEHEPGHP